ncbi:MAG TPA: hypothetical protein DCP91_01350 [Eggerthellaceae bacterium]|nr:hypothetical protein [Eggerthellaceae bacterium]
MEVKIYFKDGTVEAHHLPEIVGETFSDFDKSTGREKSRSSIDRIKDVVERLELRDEGYVLVRKIVYNTAEDFEQLRTSEYCVVPMPAFAHVKYVLVDDEQVWASKASKTAAGQQKLEKNW